MLKCNTDGACRGNPGMGAAAFCIRNDRGELIYAKSKALGETTSVEAEVVAIQQAILVCQEFNYLGVQIETDSLLLTKMINRQWRVPWTLMDLIDEIKFKMNAVHGSIKHVFREGNQVADALANEVFEAQQTKIFSNFTDLPANIN